MKFEVLVAPCSLWAGTKSSEEHTACAFLSPVGGGSWCQQTDDTDCQTALHQIPEHYF